MERLRNLKVIGEALKALDNTATNAGGDSREDCEGKNYDACKPTLEIDEARRSFDFLPKGNSNDNKLFLTCGANSALQSRDKALVLFVSLNLIQSRDLAVTKIALDGTIASIFLEGNVSPNEVGVMRVVGGHYIPGDSHPIIGTRVGLPVEPRCSVHAIRIPRIAWLESKQSMLVVSRSEPGATPEPLLTCQPKPQVDHIDVRLPSTRRVKEHRLTWTLGTSTSLSAQWIGIRPPADLSLRFSKFGFKWRPDCTYPLKVIGDPDVDAEKANASCPHVEVAGITCTGKVVEESIKTEAYKLQPSKFACVYTCETNGSFDLPALTSFRAASSTDAWTGRIDIPDQQIADYVPPDQRRVVIAFDDWRHLGIGGRSRIQGVDLTFPNGEQRFLPTKRMSLFAEPNAPEPSQQIAISRLSCDEPVKHRARGVGSEDQEGFIERGQLKIPPPQCDLFNNGPGNCIKGFARVGVEFAKVRGDDRPPTVPVLGPAPVHGYGLTAEWGGVWAWPEEPYLMRTALRATLGAREYLLRNAALENHVAPAFYGRIGYNLHLGLRSPQIVGFVPEMRMGVGAGLGYGHTLQGGRGGAIGGDVYFEPSVFLQIKWLSVSGRWLLFEQLNQVEDGTARLLGTTGASYFLLDLGIEMDL